MIKKLLCVVLLFCCSISSKAQFFTQNFSTSTNVSDYVSATPNSGQFNDIVANSANLTASIQNGALRFNRTAAATIYAYRNFTFTTNPNHIQLIMVKYN